MTNLEGAQKLAQIISESNYEATAYSGRGMFGRECLSVNPDATALQFFADLLDIISDGASDEIAAIQDDMDTLSKAMQSARVDDLGLGVVIYWPSLPFVEV